MKWEMPCQRSTSVRMLRPLRCLQEKATLALCSPEMATSGRVLHRDLRTLYLRYIMRSFGLILSFRSDLTQIRCCLYVQILLRSAYRASVIFGYLGTIIDVNVIKIQIRFSVRQRNYLITAGDRKNHRTSSQVPSSVIPCTTVIKKPPINVRKLFSFIPVNTTTPTYLFLKTENIAKISIISMIKTVKS